MTDLFTHLHLHTQYSFLDGLNKVEEVAIKCKELGMQKCAITDHGHCCGHKEAYKVFKKHGVEPILGSEVYYTPDRHVKTKDTPIYHLVILPQNYKGLQNLYMMLYHANKDGFYKKPRVDKDLLTRYGSDIVVLQACLAGELAQAVLNKDPNLALLAGWWKKTFGDRFFLELQPNTLPEQILVNEKFVELSKLLNINLVGTLDAHYISKDKSRTQLIHVANGYGCTFNELIQQTPKELIENPTLFLATHEEAYDLFKTVPMGDVAYRNTKEVADMCSPISYPDGSKIFFPIYSKEESFDSKKELYQKSLNSLKAKGLDNEKYIERLDYEYSVITKLNYENYFLILSDVFDFCRQAKVRTSYGRGSAAGCLISYLLGITRVDPVAHGLKFERFLNEFRVSPPDIDSDFSQERREEVIEYVRSKYGKEKFAQIGTFAELKAKSIINDILRVLGIPDSEAKEIRALIPEEKRGGEGEHKVTLEKVLASPEVQSYINKSATASDIFDAAKQLEGLFRQPGRHASAFVITPSHVSDFVPCMRVGGSVKDETDEEYLPVTQWDGKTVEESGLLKFDFLGLKTLDYITELENLVKLSNPTFDADNINFSDEKVIDLLIKKHTLGVFQLKEAGITEYASETFKAAKLRYGDKSPEKILDLLSLILAVYRPGPMDNGWHQDILDILFQKKQMPNDIPGIEDIISNTYGYMIYQEQVMDVFRRLGGYGLAQADLMRRAIGKKKPEEMAKLKADFLEKSSIDKDRTLRLWESIERFADYSFNASHSFSYAYLTYQTAYLKAYYPAEFIAAGMTVDANGAEAIENMQLWIKEAGSMNIEILGPDVFLSNEKFSLENGKVRFGLGAIKGLPSKTIKAIISTRDSKDDINQFFDKIKKDTNTKAIDSLINSGALDCFGYSRAALRAVKDGLSGKKVNKKLSDEKIDVFVPNIPSDKMQDLLLEQEALGMFLSSHPLDPWSDLSEAHDYVLLSKNTSRTIGVVTEIEAKTSKTGRKYIVGKFSNLSNVYEFMIFSNTPEYLQLLQLGKIFRFTGKKDSDRFLVNQVEELKETKKDTRLFVTVKTKEQIEDLDLLATDYGHPLFIQIKQGGQYFTVNTNFKMPDERIQTLEKKGFQVNLEYVNYN